MRTISAQRPLETLTVQSKFHRWSGIVHAALTTSHPKIRLGHVHELLASAFGHRTYASFRARDLAALEGPAKFVWPSTDAVLARAATLGLSLDASQWDPAVRQLKPSGVSGGTWLLDSDMMKLAAVYLLGESSHPALDALAGADAMRHGQVGHDAVVIGARDSDFPERLRFAVTGEVQVAGDPEFLAYPVLAEVAFPRVGVRMYGAGTIVSARQDGAPYPFEHEFLAEYDYQPED